MREGSLQREIFIDLAKSGAVGPKHFVVCLPYKDLTEFKVKDGFINFMEKLPTNHIFIAGFTFGIQYCDTGIPLVFHLQSAEKLFLAHFCTKD